MHELAIQFPDRRLPGAQIAVDLHEADNKTGPDEQVDHFDVAAFSREMLLNGYDEIEALAVEEGQDRSPTKKRRAPSIGTMRATGSRRRSHLKRGEIRMNRHRASSSYST